MDQHTGYLISGLAGILFGSMNIPFCMKGYNFNYFCLGACYGMSMIQIIMYLMGPN